MAFDFLSSKKTSSETNNYTSADDYVFDSKTSGGEGSLVNRDGTITVNDTSKGVVDAVTVAAATINEASSMNLRHLASTGENISRAAIVGAGNAAYEAGLVAENVSRAAITASEKSAYESGQVAKSAITGNTNVARDALDFGESVSRSGFDAVRDIGYEGQVTARAGYDAVRDIGYEGQVTARSALVNNRESFRDVLDFGAGTQGLAFDAFNKAQQSQNDLIRYTNEQFTSKLAANSGDAVQNVTQNIFKYGMIAVGVIGVAFIMRGSLFKKAA